MRSFHDISAGSKTHGFLLAITEMASHIYSSRIKVENRKRANDGQPKLETWKPEWKICEDGTMEAVVKSVDSQEYMKDIWRSLPKSISKSFGIQIKECANRNCALIFIGIWAPCSEIDAQLLDMGSFTHEAGFLQHMATFFPKRAHSGKVDPSLEYKVVGLPGVDCMYCYYTPSWFSKDPISAFTVPMNFDDYASFQAEFKRDPKKIAFREIPPDVIPAEQAANTDLPESTSVDSLLATNDRTDSPAIVFEEVGEPAPAPSSPTPVAPSATPVAASATPMPMLSPIIPGMFNSVLGFAMNLTASVGTGILSVHDAMVGTLVSIADTVTTTLASSSTTAPLPENNDSDSDNGFTMAAPSKDEARALSTNGAEEVQLRWLGGTPENDEDAPTPPSPSRTPEL